MERITSAQLNSALTAQGANLQRSLSKEDSSTLLILLNSLAKRYPSQDQAESIEEYFRDFEALALKFSLQKVEKALAALRIKPGQAFFPRPDEVAEEIEAQRERGVNDAIRRDGNKWLEDWEKHRLKIRAEREAENGEA